jgi:phosphoglycerate dehydrogenase-like enzyme
MKSRGYEKEPLPDVTDPLLSMDKLVCAPHANGSPTNVVNPEVLSRE